jgi:hypothetical protein
VGSKRGHTREAMIALLGEPGVTMKKPLSGFFLLESQPTESHFAAWWSNALKSLASRLSGFSGACYRWHPSQSGALAKSCHGRGGHK